MVLVPMQYLKAKKNNEPKVSISLEVTQELLNQLNSVGVVYTVNE